MIISFTGAVGKHDLQRYEAAIRNYASQLMKGKLVDKLFIEVEFTRGMLRETGALGYCTWEDQPKKPRDFSIELDATQSATRALQTLAHEMVHVKQFATGELEDFCRKPRQWLGKPMVEEISYQDEPWEIEAYDREDGIYRAFKESEK